MTAANNPATGNVLLAVHVSELLGVLNVPECKLAVQRADSDLLRVRAVDDGENVCLLLKGFRSLRAGEDAPNPNGTIPGPRDERGSVRSKRKSRDGPVVAREALNKLSSLHVPQMDIEAVQRASTHNLATLVHGQARKLQPGGRSKGLEVTVTDQIPGTDRAIQTCCKEQVAHAKLGCGHSRSVFAKCDDAEARCGIPDLDTAIISGGDDALAVGRVGEGVHSVKVALLLDDVRLGLPLPDQELAKLRGAKCEPLARLVDRDMVDAVLRNAESVDAVEVGELIKTKDARREADNQKVRLAVEGGALNLCVVLQKVVTVNHVPPLRLLVVHVILVVVLIRLDCVLPLTESSIATARVDALLVLGKPGSHNRVLVGGEGGWQKAIGGVQRPNAGRQVLGRGDEEARIAGPLDVVDVVVVASILAVLDERRKLALFAKRGRLPNLRLAATGHSEVGAVGGELYVVDGGLEVEVVKDGAAHKVGQDRASIWEEVRNGAPCVLNPAAYLRRPREGGFPGAKGRYGRYSCGARSQR